MSSSIQKVRNAIQQKGYGFRVVELPESTRTAQEAADAIGCSVSEIAKSLIFKGAESGKPILVIASGTNRVDTGKISSIIGQQVNKADADFIRSETGFAIGGIPPLGHAYPLQTIVDEDLLKYEVIWAAAGTPFSVFSLESKDLTELTGGTLADIREG